MQPRQIALIEESFALVAPDAAGVADAFYRRLFELDPGLRGLFKSDLTAQGRRLMDVLGYVVGGLRRLDAVLYTARHLGARHVGYGVEEHHYPIVGQALLDTLAAGLGERFDQATREAWTTAYQRLSGAMIEGAREAYTSRRAVARRRARRREVVQRLFPPARENIQVGTSASRNTAASAMKQS
jgi:nitric oxide dioxygenase